MRSPPVERRTVRRLRPVHFWTWMAILSAATVCGAVSWLHYRQREAIGHTERILEDIREARIDLSKGFLNVLNASDEESTFQRAQGLALIRQAISSLENSPYWRIGESRALQLDGGLSRREFDREASRFLGLLEDWNSTFEGREPGRGAEVRVAFHQIERQAEWMDTAGRNEFHALNSQLNREFKLTVVMAAGLLSGFCVVVFRSARNAGKAARELEEREAQLRLVGDNLPDSYLFQYRRGPDGVPSFSHISAGVERVHGLPVMQVLKDADRLFSQLEPSQRPLLQSAEAESARQLSDFAMDLVFHPVKGGRRLLHVRSRPRPGGNGTVRWDGIATDVTEIRLAAERIRLLNRVYAVLSAINQTIMREKDLDATLAAACRITVEKGGFRMAWIGLTGGPAERLILRAHAGADAGTAELLEAVIASGACAFTQEALRTGHHSICNDIEADPRSQGWRQDAVDRGYRSLGAFPLKEGDRVIGLFTMYSEERAFFDDDELQLLDELALDIAFALTVHERESRRERAEQELLLSEERFRQAQKMEAIGQLAGGVAHDFNNILAAMMLQAELAAQTENLPETVREMLDELKGSAERAAHLTRQLLAFGRRQVMQARPLDLNEVVTHLARMLKRIVGEDVRLRLSLHPRPLITRADAGMLDQVLLNLMVNARDAMPDGGTLTVETLDQTLSAEEARGLPDARAGRYVCLVVADTGCGISPANLPRIFEPFFTTKEPGKGTGLGLATVFGIVRQHQGFLQVESEPGRGTAFRIFLPAGDSAEAEPLEGPSAPAPRGGTETILVVEDEPSVRMLTRAVLERSGYTVLEAAHGREALEVWDGYRKPIHLLLTDIVMPEGMSGRALAQRLRQRNPTLRTVFTSGYSADIAGQELTLQAGQNFIQKPASATQILEIVRRSLDG